MPLNIPGQPPPVDGARDGHSQHPARGSEGGAAAGDDKPAKQGPGARATAAKVRGDRDSEPEIR